MSTITFGPFELIAPLAKGGMALTDLARVKGADPGSEFVIKRILPDVAAQRELRDLFKAEADIARALEHPNIVRTLQSGDVDGEPYLALEYVWGDDLRNLARHANKAGNPLPRALAARIARDTALGLHHAHELKTETGQPFDLVHRDVSPPNIMVRFDGSVVVIDFGIARVERRFQRVRAGQLKGKFAYMSPEQVQGLPVDRRSDVFALGVVLYEFTVGRRLFRASSDVATAAAIAATRVPPPRDVDPHFPLALQTIILKALERDPDRRYQTARELAITLEAWLDTQAAAEQTDLADWMRATFAERIQEIESFVGMAPYPGPKTPTALPSSTPEPITHPAPEAPAMSTQDQDDATAQAANATTEGASAPPAPPSTPDVLVPDDDDPFYQNKGTSRAVFIGMGVVLAAVLVVMGIKIAKDGIGTNIADDFEPAPNIADFDAAPYVPPEPPPTAPLAIASVPPGAAIVVNGIVSAEVTPAELQVVDGQVNVISLHREGYQTAFVEANVGTPVNEALVAIPAPEAPPAEDADDAAAEGSAEPVDAGPGIGRARIRVEVTATDGRAIDAEVRVNGRSVGAAPVTVDVDAGVRHHVTARMAGKRDSAAYVRPIAWVDRNSVAVVALELTADNGDANRWSTLRFRSAPQSATVTIDDETVASSGIATLASPGHHIIRVSADDHLPIVRAVDGRLGQMTLDAVLDVVRNDPATLTISAIPEGTTVYIERLRNGSPGARELRSPIEEVSVESGTHRLTLEHRSDDGRVRGRFELDFDAGAHHVLGFDLVDGEFQQTGDERTPGPQ